MQEGDAVKREFEVPKASPPPASSAASETSTLIAVPVNAEHRAGVSGEREWHQHL